MCAAKECADDAESAVSDAPGEAVLKIGVIAAPLSAAPRVEDTLEVPASAYSREAEVADADACARLFDPRVVLLQVVLAAACGFCLNRPAASAAAGVAIAIALAVIGCRRQALVLLVWTAVVNALCLVILAVPSWGAVGAFVVVFFVLRKAVPLAGAALLFLNGVTVSRLIAVLTLWRLPKPFVLTLAVAYRFVPTVGNEVSLICDALAMRGRPLTVRGFLRSPREMLECVLVPLMMRCTRVADELAASATARAVENPASRVSRYELKMRGRDGALLAATLVCAAAVVALELA